RAFMEAEAYKGPSLILAYAHCIAHGYDISAGYEHQKKAVACGHWPLYRYNPDLAAQGQNPLQLDSKEPTGDLAEYRDSETRYKALRQIDPQATTQLLEMAQRDVKMKWRTLQGLASIQYNGGTPAQPTA
ncbi:MAG TPA: hypothetical protein VLH60_05820, partial [Sedimentisphaerales bacterium]|nr:hypothetical protein [Sedimentisphaerales bacterium]